MKLIVGLGNPGPEYEGTRHNIGFEVLDTLAEDLDVRISRSGYDGLYARYVKDGETVLLLKPQTYMNLSGRSVKAALDYYKIMPSDLVVVSDDLALEPGALRLREKGSSGGHKGLQSIIESIGTTEFKRIRIGVGEPDRDVVDYVLGRPDPDDREAIDRALDAAVMAIESYLNCQNFSKVCSLFNRKGQL